MASNGGGGGMPYIGSRIRLISKSEIRYEGILYTIDMKESSIALQGVRSFGTEGRRPNGPEIPPSAELYDYIVFRGSDIKDLEVISQPDEVAQAHTPAPPPPTTVHPPAQNPWGAPQGMAQTPTPYGAAPNPWGAPAPSAPGQSPWTTSVATPPPPGAGAQVPPGAGGQRPTAPAMAVTPSAPPPNLNAPAAAPISAPPAAAPAAQQRAAAEAIKPKMPGAPSRPGAPAWATPAAVPAPAPVTAPPKAAPAAPAPAAPAPPAPAPAPAPAPVVRPSSYASAIGGGRGGGPAPGQPNVHPHRGGRGGRGGHPQRAPNPAGRGGRGHHQSAPRPAAAAPLPIPVPSEDFNFEEQLKKFNKESILREEAAKEITKEPVYQKDDFFDSMSCEALERMALAEEQQQRPRMNYAEQRKTDMETFGGLGPQYGRHGHHGGRGGRGGGGRGSHQQGQQHLAGRGNPRQSHNGRGGGNRPHDQRRDPRSGRPMEAK